MTRYAGDYFGISLDEDDDRNTSKLLGYFPGLRNISGKEDPDPDGAKLYGGKTAPKAFGGYKPNIGSNYSRGSNSSNPFAGSKPGEF